MRLTKDNLNFLGYNLEMLTNEFVDTIKGIWCPECKNQSTFVPAKIDEAGLRGVQCNKCEIQTNNIDKIVKFNNEKFAE